MSASTGRVGAVIRKELAEFRRNRLIVTTLVPAMLRAYSVVGSVSRPPSSRC